jgi:hypothetical protein
LENIGNADLNNARENKGRIDYDYHKKVDDMMGFNNGILIAYGMCPPCKLLEYYQLDPECAPTHFMRGTADKV